MKKKLWLLAAAVLCLAALCGTALGETQIGELNADGYPESAHPYADNSDITWTYVYPGSADYLKITFTNDSEVENNYDKVYLKGTDGVENMYTGPLSGVVVYTAGNSFTLRFTSDSSVQKYGFAVASVTPATAEEKNEFENTPHFTFSNGTITRYTGGVINLVIPAEIDGQAVTTIGANAFSSGTFETVTVSNGITTIGNDAFSSCANLKQVTLANSVTSIGSGAFRSCGKMEHIAFSSNLTSIGSGAFWGCNVLEEINLPEGLLSIGDEAFGSCHSLTEVTLPASLTTLGGRTFPYCQQLESFRVAKGSNSFTVQDGVLFDKDMTTLIAYPAQKKGASYQFPASVTSVRSAFCLNSYLTSLTLSANTRDLDSLFMESCYNLTDYYVADGNTVYESVDGVLFSKDRSELVRYPCGRKTAAYTVPNGVTQIGGYAFWGVSLPGVTLPEGLTAISYCAFENSGISEILFPESLQTLDSSCFSYCYNLEEIVLPSGVTQVGQGAFTQCERLNSVTVMGMDTEFSYNVFSGAGTSNGGLTIYGLDGSLAQDYAGTQNIAFEVIGEAVERPQAPDIELRQDGSALTNGEALVGVYYDLYYDTHLENSVNMEVMIGYNDGYRDETYNTYPLYVYAQGTLYQEIRFNWETNWWIRARIQVDGVWSLWSTKQWFRASRSSEPIDAPVIVSAPSSAQVGEQFSITFQAVENAQSYSITIENDGGRAARADWSRRNDIITAEFYDWYDSAAAGEYQLIVRARADGYDDSNAVSSQSITLTASQRPTPGFQVQKNGQNVTGATLTKNNYYDVVFDLGGFSGDAFRIKCEGEQWSHYYGPNYLAEPAQQYTYTHALNFPQAFPSPVAIRVQFRSNGVWSCWSEAQTFALIDAPTIPVPVAINPPTTVTRYSTITIQLEENPDVSSYNMYIKAPGSSNRYTICYDVPGPILTMNWWQEFMMETGSFTLTIEPNAEGYDTSNSALTMPITVTPNTGYPATTHPVTPRSEVKWKYRYPGEADYLRVTFSEQCDLDFWVYLIDSNGNWLADYNGTELAGAVVYIQGGSFSLEYYTGDDDDSYGFEVTDITAISAEEFFGSQLTVENGVITECTIYELDELNIPSVINGQTIVGIGDYAFNNHRITRATIPQGVTSIGEGAFKNCYNMQSVTLPDGLLTIGAYAFASNEELSEITIPASVTDIGAYAFSWSGLTEATIQSNVTMGDYAFYDCESLATLTVADGVTALNGDTAFNCCYALETAHIPASVTEISDGMFYGCDDLTIFGYLYSYAQEYAQENGIAFVANLTQPMDHPDFILPAALNEIDEEAFAGIAAQVVKLDEGVASIGSKAFADCQNLRQIYIPVSAKTIAEDAFDNVTGLIIFGAEGSDAQTFAQTHRYAFVPVQPQ